MPRESAGGGAGGGRTSGQGGAGQAEGDDDKRDQGETALPDPPLAPLRLDILHALRTLKATDSEKRVTGAKIAKKVGGDATAQSVKAPLADLKRRGLVDSRTGKKGGSWISSQGLVCINSLRPQQ
jgi:hypothetical protein